MPTLNITVDPECGRCSSKIQNVLRCVQERGEFVIEKVMYEKDKVIVSGPFDAEKLACKLCCKAGRIIKNIEIVKPPLAETDKKEPKKEEPKLCKLVPYPYPWPCSCAPSYCRCPAKILPPSPPKPKSKPEPAPCKLLPCPCPFPCPPPAWPCSCPPPYCQCNVKPPAPEPVSPPPQPEPPKAPACQCPTWPCHCYGYPLPPRLPYPMVVCDESPPYGSCVIM
ncbi:hypothetical protein EJB05_38216 [Eragrostis curvula]|uniref:HMA domain-containing protein n=1 Tax=Eragrostis curvula TaxID=38414 RepID=A0A5J9TTK2_9POAL|nr:hypothetical protein EJB05_38216 [Eragrostis curvula]